MTGGSRQPKEEGESDHATIISTKRRATTRNQVVSREEWLKARLELLAAEKEFTRQRDALTRRRMAMPWERVEKPCRFEGPNGPLSLADLFDGRSQLIVYHFMFAPDWEEGCKSCSFWADNFNGIPIHLNHRDATFTAISRAPLAKINAYKQRMGWSFPWVSSYESDFNFDYHVSFTPEEIDEGAMVPTNSSTLCPKAAMRTTLISRWSGYAGTISIEAPSDVWGGNHREARLPEADRKPPFLKWGLGEPDPGPLGFLLPWLERMRPEVWDVALKKARMAGADSGAVPVVREAKRRSLPQVRMAYSNHRIPANTGWAHRSSAKASAFPP